MCVGYNLGLGMGVETCNLSLDVGVWTHNLGLDVGYASVVSAWMWGVDLYLSQDVGCTSVTSARM